MNTRVSLLCTSLLPASGIPEEGRQLAAVMLRRLISSDFAEFYNKIGDDEKAQFRGEMLNLVKVEPSRNVRRKLVDLVAEIARNLTDDDGNCLWPEFLKFTFELASSGQQAEMREAALMLFGAVPTIFGGSQHSQYVDVIRQMLLSSLTDASSYDVRFNAVKSSVNYLMVHEKDAAVLKHLADLLNPLLAVTMESIEKADDDSALKAIIDMAETCPKFLRPQLEQLFAACIRVRSLTGRCCPVAAVVLVLAVDLVPVAVVDLCSTLAIANCCRSSRTTIRTTPGGTWPWRCW